jgi:hypothetical protein
LTDFRNADSYAQWDYSVDYQYWKGLWGYVGCDKGTPDEIVGIDGGGICYRFMKQLPNQYNAMVEFFKKNSDPNKRATIPFTEWPLQFYSTKDFHAIAAQQGKTKDIARVVVSWSGFPKRILDLFHDSNVNPYEYVERIGWPSPDVTYRRYAQVPQARQMDEYCEWYTHRNAQGKITRIDISCESPEYWKFLVENEPDTATALYQKYVSKDVKTEDLLVLEELIKNKKRVYNPYNKWNTQNGMMHLNCPPNSLFAEVFIAAEASTRWGVPGSKTATHDHYDVATSGVDLIQAGEYGLQTRNSDPTIGYNVNYYARNDLILSVENPVGLYFQDLNTTGWLCHDKRPFTEDQLAQIIHYERGATQDKYPDIAMNMHSRIRIEIPSTWGYTLGDCFIGGSPLDYAGKLIDSSVTVFLVALGFAPDKGFNFSANEIAATVPPKSVWTSEHFLTNDEVSSVVVPPPDKPASMQ